MRKLLKNFTGKDWMLVALSVVFVVIGVGMELTMPEYMSEITRLCRQPEVKCRKFWLPEENGCSSVRWEVSWLP